MTTIEGIECLVLIMIVENFTVLKITNNFLGRVQVSKTVEIYDPVPVLLISYPMRSRTPI